MKKNILPLIFSLLLLFVLAACNLPSGTAAPDTLATMRALTTSQAATRQVEQTQPAETQTTAPLPTLSFPTLPPLTTPETPATAPAPSATTRPANTVTSYCNWAAYVKDVTIPDGTIMAPEATFKKTWRLQNIGDCAWTTSYDLVFSGGELMNGSTVVPLASTVQPNQTIDISVNLKAPTKEGAYRGYWGLRSAAGIFFGIGNTASQAFYVDIRVVGGMTTVFNFAKEYCHADWRSEAGDLGCPGNVGGKKGYAIQVEDPQLEDGTDFNGLAILTVPQRVYNGYLQGYYQEFAVKSGDRFRAIISCEYLSTGCSVLFRLDYQINDGAVKTLWQYPEAYEGQYYTADVDLSALAGKKVKFILTVLANGSADADKPLWVAPRIARLSSRITPTTQVPSQTRTPTRTRTPKITATPQPSKTITSTGAPSLTPSMTMTSVPPTLTPTETFTPTHTPSPTATVTPTP